MSRSDDEGIFVRIDVWLIVGQRAPVRVNTRTLSEDGVFLEFTGPLRGNEVEVIFQDPGTPDGESHKIGKVVGRALQACLRKAGNGGEQWSSGAVEQPG